MIGREGGAGGGEGGTWDTPSPWRIYGASKYIIQAYTTTIRGDPTTGAVGNYEYLCKTNCGTIRIHRIGSIEMWAIIKQLFTISKFMRTKNRGYIHD